MRLCLPGKGFLTEPVRKEYERKGGKNMSQQKIRIRLKAYDHKLLDVSAVQIVDTAKRSRRSSTAKRKNS